MNHPFVEPIKVNEKSYSKTYMEALRQLIKAEEERETKIKELEESKECNLMNDDYAMTVAKIVTGMTDSASKITIKPRNPKDLSRIEFVIKIGHSERTEFGGEDTIWITKKRKWYPRDKWTQLIRNLYDEWVLDPESNKYVYVGDKYK